MWDILSATVFAIPLLISDILALEPVTPGGLMGELVVCSQLDQTKDFIGHLAEGLSAEDSVITINDEQTDGMLKKCAIGFYIYDVNSFEPELMIEVDGDQIVIIPATVYGTFDPETYEEYSYPQAVSVHTAMLLDDLISIELDLQIIEMLREAE